MGVVKLDDLLREMAANWESLRPEERPGVDAGERARLLGAWNEHRQIYGYTLLSELPYGLMTALRDHPDLRGVDFDLLVVDEYQDLNACDLEIFRLLADRGCTVIAAGDDDQSIYSFRKADPEGIRRFPTDYPGSADYPLSVTQRCGRKIIEGASFVIEGDPDRPAGRPRLTSASGSPDGEVALLSFDDQASEAEGIASLIQRLVRVEGVPPSEILVLLRSDHNGSFSKPIKENLARLGVPSADPDAVPRLLGEDANRQLLAMFRLLVHREDSLAWATQLLLTTGVGQAFLDYVYEKARVQRQPFGKVLLELSANDFAGGPRGSTGKANLMIRQALNWLNQRPVPEQRDGRWGQWIIETAANGFSPTPTQALKELLLALDEQAEPEQGLGRYLGQIAPLGKDMALAHSAGVRIMTMNGAKGLTVRATIIAALEEGLVPRPDCDLGEERRLLYVAMTRAKKFLFVTWARRRRGPTARAGAARVGAMRRHSHFLDGGPERSQDGPAYIDRRWSRT
jgi:DNA helicase-2/ATP-dependent DNA helicase PcrA